MFLRQSISTPSLFGRAGWVGKIVPISDIARFVLGGVVNTFLCTSLVNPMDRVSGQNNRNESQIEFVSDDCANHDSSASFYAAAIRLIWTGWDSNANTDKYIRNAVQTTRSLADLQRRVAVNLSTTPIPGFTPALDSPVDIHSFRDDWNVQEFVWVSGGRYHFMGWDTAA